MKLYNDAIFYDTYKFFRFQVYAILKNIPFIYLPVCHLKRYNGDNRRTGENRLYTFFPF